MPELEYTQAHLTAREAALSKFFTVLGVNAPEERIEGYLEATLAIPWKREGVYYFTGALAKLTQDKRDGYTTAPQPGEIWKAAESLIPRNEIEHRGSQGTLPPRWWGHVRREQMRLAQGDYSLGLATASQRALGSG